MAQRNVLFIMCDQLRFDYLSCYGNTKLHTPNIDALAARGVRFDRAYVQSPVCGPSRMSFYTGRYMRSHGSNWNGFPLRVGEPTLGEHLREVGVRTALVGKTHMAADREGMKRLGIAPDGVIGVHAAQCGFEPFERDDGLHPDPVPRPAYDAYLREHGFEASNPWEHWANSAEGPDGLQNGWLLVHADKPARVPEEHSETSYITRRAIDFLDDAKLDGRPWCLHVSYIKPHWPYIAPAPYHAMYIPSDALPVRRSERERQNPHPVYDAFMRKRVSQNFSRDEVRERVIPAYMGLIKQIDDQIGVLILALADRGLMENTMVVFTSDHGDYLGDHWMGEKDLFHECSVRVPLIIADPSSQADVTRGTVSEALVEAIDLAPSFVEYFGAAARPHILEGHSLLPLLAGAQTWTRQFVVSEYDYAMQEVRRTLGRGPSECRLFMIADDRWKYIEAPGFRPMLFDRLNDPDEFVDLGDDPDHAGERARLREALFTWALSGRSSITMPEARIEAYSAAAQLKSGFIIGYWDEAELDAARLLWGLREQH